MVKNKCIDNKKLFADSQKQNTDSKCGFNDKRLSCWHETQFGHFETGIILD